jgi:hypothetical protein
MTRWGRIGAAIALSMSMSLTLNLVPHTARADGDAVVPPVVPLGFGVNIHFTDPKPGEMERFAEAGYRFVRMDLHWGGIERQRGRYDFSAFDRLVAHLKKANARPIFILDYGNPLYDDGQAPRTNAGREAYARYAAAAAKHYRGQGVIFEIWNEPNLDNFWKPRANADDYAKLALMTAKAVRQADPSSVLLAPGSSGFPWEFFETVFRSGLLAEIDAVSVHPYRGSNPETAHADYERLRGLIARHAPAGRRDLPIISSEWGYSTHEKGVSEATQARYLTRQWLSNLAAGVNLFIFYDWKDDGPDPKENEHRFGTVRQDLTPKPSFEAARALIAGLNGHAFRHRLAGASPSDWSLLFQKGDSDELAVVSWSSDPTAPEASQAPSIRKVAATDPDFGPLRALASVRWTAGPRGEVGDDRLTLAIEAVHPDAGTNAKPGRLTVAAGPGQAIASRVDEITVAPNGKATNAVLALPGSPLRGPRREIPISLAWNGEALPTLAPLVVVRGDPLLIAAAPRGSKLIVTMTNPSRRSFTGRVVVTGAPDGRALGSADVSLADGAERIEAALPLPPDGQAFVVEVQDTDRRALARGPSRRFRAAPELGEGVNAVLHVDNKNKPAKPVPVMSVGGEKALDLKYTFDPGWRYLTVEVPSTFAAIPNDARALMLWVKGDGSGNALRARFVDASGQVFQVNAAGPGTDGLTWTGWRAVTVPLDGQGDVSTWGGAGDGRVHGARTWQALVLIDSANQRNPKSGGVQLAAPTYELVPAR